jgi:hypothetical protein
MIATTATGFESLAQLISVATAGAIRSDRSADGSATVATGASDQLRELELMIARVLSAAAPSTWAANRRVLLRVMRAARRERRTNVA